MYERRSRHPDRVAAALLLLDQHLRHVRVVDRLLSRHLARHERERLGIHAGGNQMRLHEDALAPVFLLADRHHVAALEPPSFADPQHAVAVEDEAGVHTRFARCAPRTVEANERRKVGRRKEPFGKNAVGRRGSKARVRCVGEFWLCKVGRREGCHAMQSAWTAIPLATPPWDQREPLGAPARRPRATRPSPAVPWIPQTSPHQSASTRTEKSK